MHYSLAGCSSFAADIGIDDDDEEAANGSVGFQVWAGGVKIYDSGLMTGSAATQSVNVSVAGKNELVLIVTDGGNGNWFDHADWANAQLTCG